MIEIFFCLKLSNNNADFLWKKFILEYNNNQQLKEVKESNDIEVM